MSAFKYLWVCMKYTVKQTYYFYATSFWSQYLKTSTVQGTLFSLPLSHHCTKPKYSWNLKMCNNGTQLCILVWLYLFISSDFKLMKLIVKKCYLLVVVNFLVSVPSSDTISLSGVLVDIKLDNLRTAFVSIRHKEIFKIKTLFFPYYQ